MEDKIIKDFLLSKRGYLKKGNVTIQDALVKKYGIAFHTDDIRSCKKAVKKSLKKIRNLDVITEDFRENIQRVEAMVFTPIKKAPKVALSTNIAPDIADQEGMHILMGCNHVPFHHKRLHDGIRKMMLDHSDKIVGFHLMGDFADINTLSSHDKGRFTAVPGLTLDDEYAACNDELDMFAQAMSPNVWKTYLYGNHEITLHLVMILRFFTEFTLAYIMLKLT